MALQQSAGASAGHGFGMAILFAIFLALGLILGWMRDSSFAPVWSCIVINSAKAPKTKLVVARWRFKAIGSHAWRGAGQHIATNWLLALGVGAIALALLALPVLDSAKTFEALGLVIVFEFVAVCSFAAVISARRQGESPTRMLFLRDFGNYALLDVVSMVVGVLAGRLYLNVIYPGVG